MYSFQDLFNAANFNQSTSILSKMDQESINTYISHQHPHMFKKIPLYY